MLADRSALFDVRFFVPESRGHTRVSNSATAGRHADGGLHDVSGAAFFVDRHRVRLRSLFELVEQPRPHIGLADGPEPARRTRPHLDKVLVRRLMAWDGWAARSFALDCAARVLPILRWHAPDDDRPDDILSIARAGLEARETVWQAPRVQQMARDYEANIAEHACHPAILPAARACVATVRPCAWGSARASAAQGADAEANRAAWDAAWMAARDAAWFACTSAETDAASAAAWERTWAETFDEVRRWQAVVLAERLGLDR